MVKLNGKEIKTYKSDYEKQALDFLKETNTKMYINYYDCVLDPWENSSRDYANQYKVIIKRDNKQMTVKFTDSVYNTYNHEEPTAYDILACLTKYDPYSFEDFCSDYGYDIDSRKAYKTYLAVQREYDNIERLFGDVMEKLQEIY